MNDAALVGLALTNPQQGVAAIYDRYGTSLYNYCYSILRSQADAGDALQESFVTVMGKLGQLREPDKLRPWLYAICRNQCFKQHRQRARERPEDSFETGEEQTIMAASTSEPTPPTELVTMVWEATAGLSDVDRSVLELNIRHELDGEELANSMGLPGPKCSVILHRAKERLKTAVGALIVSKVGVDACGDLAGIVSGHEFSPLVRKRVARHITSCEICAETERRHRPEAYLAAVPLLSVPTNIHHGVLQAIQNSADATPDAGDADPGQADPGQATGNDPNPSEPGQLQGQGGQSSRRPHGQQPTRTSGLVGSDQTVWNEAGFPLLAYDDEPDISSIRSRVALGVVGCVVVAALVLMLLNPFERETTIIAAAGPPVAPTEQPLPQFLPTEPALPPTAVAAVPSAPSPEPANAAAPEPTSTPDAEPAAPATPQPTAVPPPAAATEPTLTPTTAPTPTPSPTPTSTSTPTLAPTPTPTAGPPVAPPAPPAAPTSGPAFVDLVAPTISDFFVTCTDPFRITVTISDTLDPSPIADLEVTWEDESDPALPLIKAAGNTYRVSVPRSELVGERIDFFVRGTLSDSSGNNRSVDLTDGCTIIG